MNTLNSLDIRGENSHLSVSPKYRGILRALLLSSFIVCFHSSTKNLPSKNKDILLASQPSFIKREALSDPRIGHLSEPTHIGIYPTPSSETPVQEERESNIYDLLYGVERFSTTIRWAGYEEDYILKIKRREEHTSITLTHESNDIQKILEFQDLPPEVYQDFMNELINQVHTYKEQQSLPTLGTRSSAIG